MFNKFLLIPSILIGTLLLSGCGSESADEKKIVEDESEKVIVDNNKTLRASESIKCSQTKSFTLTPSEEEPNITIVKDVTSNEIIISVDSDSAGYIIVSNCIKSL